MAPLRHTQGCKSKAPDPKDYEKGGILFELPLGAVCVPFVSQFTPRTPVFPSLLFQLQVWTLPFATLASSLFSNQRTQSLAALQMDASSVAYDNPAGTHTTSPQIPSTPSNDFEER